jgi:hypothetical protein
MFPNRATPAICSLLKEYSTLLIVLFLNPRWQPLLEVILLLRDQSVNK